MNMDGSIYQMEGLNGVRQDLRIMNMVGSMYQMEQ